MSRITALATVLALMTVGTVAHAQTEPKVLFRATADRPSDVLVWVDSPQGVGTDLDTTRFEDLFAGTTWLWLDNQVLLIRRGETLVASANYRSLDDANTFWALHNRREYTLDGSADRDLTPYGQKVEDNIIHELVAELESTSDYRKRRDDIAALNASSPVLKRGLALAPVKFGISFNLAHLNQAGALVHVYTDGSVHLNHGGTEMGQGLFVKVAQVVAEAFQIDLDRVRVSATSTAKAFPADRGKGGNVGGAKAVGEEIARKAQAAGVTTVVFDRAGHRYHGRIKAVAEAIAGVGNCHAIRSHGMPDQVHLDLHIVVSEDITARQAQDIEALVRAALLRAFPMVAEVAIHHQTETLRTNLPLGREHLQQRQASTPDESK